MLTFEQEIVKSDEALKQLDQELDLTRDQHRLERLIFTNRSKIAMLEKEIGSDIVSLIHSVCSPAHQPSTNSNLM